MGFDLKRWPLTQPSTGAAAWRLSRALKDNPPYEADGAMLKRLKRLGITPGEVFDASKVDPAVARGMDKAAKKIFNLLGTGQFDPKVLRA